MKRNKRIHFIGIKGVGMAPLAIIAKEAGLNVTGCDVDQEFITDQALEKAKIQIFKNFSREHVLKTDLVITTGAHGGLGSEEVAAAKENKIPVMSQGEALGAFMKGEFLKRKFKGISITGTHGKTTTTAMIATILNESKLDPSYLIGTSSIDPLGLPGHLGKGEYFVAEADEYVTDPILDRTPKFLWQEPEIEVFTNCELDHPDVYSSIEDLKIAFLKFAGKLDGKGLIVANGDDRNLNEIFKNYEGKIVTFGFSPNNDYSIKNINVKDSQTFFWIESRNANLGEFVIHAGGKHNAMNALAAISVCNEIGLSKEVIKKGLAAFKGSKRRFEFIGKTKKGALVYDDYAHHPTEIKKSIEFIKEAYPKMKVICIFQPHTYSRTRKLFEQFSSSFLGINQVILIDIFSSSREKEDSEVSSKDLALAVNSFSHNALFLSSAEDVVKYIDQKQLDQGTIILTMGAGDVYKIGQKIINI